MNRAIYVCIMYEKFLAGQIDGSTCGRIKLLGCCEIICANLDLGLCFGVQAVLMDCMIDACVRMKKAEDSVDGAGNSGAHGTTYWDAAVRDVLSWWCLLHMHFTFYSFPPPSIFHDESKMWFFFVTSKLIIIGGISH